MMVLGEVKENLVESPVKPELKNVSVGLAFAASSQADIRRRVFSYMASNRKISRTSMVIEAIEAIATDEQGASIPAITKWIIGNYAIEDVNKLKIQIKKAILKVLDNGEIKRSRTSKGALGVSGSFVLNQKRTSSSPKEKRNSKLRITKPRTRK